MKRAKTIYSGTLNATKAAEFFDRMHALKDALEQLQVQYAEDIAEVVTELSDAQSIDPALIRMAFTQERQKRKREAKIAKMDGGKAHQLDLLADAAAGSAALGGPVSARRERSKARMSESMADHKVVSQELVEAGLISPENHAENVRLADAIADKFGKGPASLNRLIHAVEFAGPKVSDVVEMLGQEPFDPETGEIMENKFPQSATEAAAAVSEDSSIGKRSDGDAYLAGGAESGGGMAPASMHANVSEGATVWRVPTPSPEIPSFLLRKKPEAVAAE